MRIDIDKFVENNKIWLDKFDHTDSNRDTVLPAWWFGGITYCDAIGLRLLVDVEDDGGVSIFYSETLNKDKLLYQKYRSGDGDEDSTFHCYFVDWCRPTKDESDYFEMIEGYRLPWNEEHPFILPEYINE